MEFSIVLRDHTSCTVEGDFVSAGDGFAAVIRNGETPTAVAVVPMERLLMILPKDSANEVWRR